MKLGAIQPALPPRLARARATRAPDAEKAAPVIELRLEIRSKPGDDAAEQAKDRASRNGTDSREMCEELRNASTFVAQVIGQILDAPVGRSQARSYVRTGKVCTSHLYDRNL